MKRAGCFGWAAFFVAMIALLLAYYLSHLVMM